MNSFCSNGVDIHFDVAGEGKPVFLVHGFGGDFSVNWKQTGWFDFLQAHGRKIIAMDLRGHGRSRKFHHPDAYSPERMGQDILDLMHHLDIEKTDIIGYSMGAWLTLYLLAAAPQCFCSGILGGIGDRFMNEPGRGEKIAQAVTAKMPRHITDPTLRMVRDFADDSGGDLLALAACSRGVHAAEPPSCECISQPVLIVGGGNDNFVGTPAAISKRMPHAVVHMLPDVSHLSLVMDGRFKEKAADFLADPEKACHPFNRRKALQDETRPHH